MLKNYLEGALEPPTEQFVKGTDVWLEQQVWGHRLYNDQTPWFLLLEALGIMSFRNEDKNFDRIFPGLPEGGKHERFSYSLAARRELRTILFKDRHIEEIADSDEYGSDNTRWSKWFERIGANAETKFGYLKDRFTRFSSFRNAVVLLRSAEIESGRKRRATSRHLAPRGPAMLAADFGEKKTDKADKDRRFFSRGGELLYLMLNRSSLRDRLEPLVKERLLAESSRWNGLAKVMQPKEQDPPLDFDLGYLPLPSHKAYERIAEDWLAVLSLGELPDDNLPEPLMRLTGFGIIRYMIERAAETLGSSPPPIPLDMVSTATVGVKRISQDCFRRHRDMTRLAISKLTEDFAASEEWKEALSKPQKVRAANDLAEQRFGFAWGENETRPEPEGYPDHIAREALEDHDQHLGRVVGFYAEQIGLAVAVRGKGRWYAASDGLLEALVLANVKEPLEFESFLVKLWERYGIVAGSEVGRAAFKAANYGHFKANQRLLEERLRVLGLVHRLSDDCAFVHNPFYEVG